jgi:hypothetical protein
MGFGGSIGLLFVPLFGKGTGEAEAAVDARAFAASAAAVINTSVVRVDMGVSGMCSFA